MNNNPVRYSDPSGHRVCDEERGCEGEWRYTKRTNPIDIKTAVEKSVEKPIGYDGWDLVPYLNSLRRIIRGYQESQNAYNNPVFASQQAAFQTWHNNCYGQCHYAHAAEYDPSMPVGGPQPDVPVVDLYSAGMGDVAGGTVDLGLQVATTVVAANVHPVQVFAHGGTQWHLGLETPTHMNIIHIGNHNNFGVHIAFGAVKPYVANLHIYLQKSFPFFRVWKP